MKSGVGVLFLGSVWIAKAGLGAEISMADLFIGVKAQPALRGTRILLSVLPVIILFS